MNKGQCTALINAIAECAKYLAQVQIQFDDKPFNASAPSTLETEFDTAIAGIVDEIPDDAADNTEPPANDNDGET